MVCFCPDGGFPGYAGNYAFHGDAMQIFEQFFGGTNPFTDFFAMHNDPHASDDSNKFGKSFGGMHGMSTSLSRDAKVDESVYHDLKLTLEQLYSGCLRKMKVSRKIMNEDGATTRLADKILTIEIVPGTKPGTKIIFPKQGDQGPNVIPGL